MRYITPPEPDTTVWQDQRIHTTGGRYGSVVNAYVYKGVIRLYCLDDDDNQFLTDNEHCTIVRNSA